MNVLAVCQKEGRRSKISEESSSVEEENMVKLTLISCQGLMANPTIATMNGP